MFLKITSLTSTSLNPSPFDISDLSNHKNITDEDFLDEVKGIWYLSLLGHGPRYITHVTVDAGAEFPYPEGRVCVLVTDRVPGGNVDEIQGGLTDGQIESIGVQLGYILEYVGPPRVERGLMGDGMCG